MNPRVIEIQKERQAKMLIMQQAMADIVALDKEELEILTGKVRPEKPVSLTFSKNVIRWEDGALAISGKGYRFVKALYEANDMRLEIAVLEEIVWKDDMEEKGKVIRQNTFRVALLRLAEKLERAKFPYRLLPERSKEKHEVVKRKPEDKPTTKRIQSEIIGARLDVTVKRTNVTSD